MAPTDGAVFPLVVSVYHFCMRISVAASLAVVAVSSLWPFGPLRAEPPSSPARAMASVVAVLPDWPGGYRPAAGTLEEPEGSAVAVFPGGYFATNAHVLGRATRLDVRLADGRLAAAAIIGRDGRTDIALIRVEGDFPVPEIADAPEPGGRVCAIGNAFGLGVSVACGVVSALNRSNAGFNHVEDFVQTDAAVNPGASGGALVDGKGRLVGLLSAIFTKKSDANIGINFAVSSRLLMRVVDDLKQFGRVRAAAAGWRLAPLDAAERRHAAGVRVVSVTEGGAAARAGLGTGDLLVRVDDRAIALVSDARAAVFLKRPGERVTLQVVRQGRPHHLEMTLSE